MAKFIEYKTSPSWTAFISWCWGAVIPLLAVILFLKGVVSMDRALCDRCLWDRRALLSQ